MDHFCDHSIIRSRVLVLRSTEIMVFLRDSRNREGNFEQVTMLHDMAGCMRAKETHDLLDEKNVDFFRFSGYGRWPGKSPDMNPAESVGAILQESVEDELIEKDPATITREDLVRAVTKTLRRLERNTTLFTNLLRSFRHRLDLVKAAGGKNIDGY